MTFVFLFLPRFLLSVVLGTFLSLSDEHALWMRKIAKSKSRSHDMNVAQDIFATTGSLSPQIRGGVYHLPAPPPLPQIPRWDYPNDSLRGDIRAISENRIRTHVSSCVTMREKSDFRWKNFVLEREGILRSFLLVRSTSPPPAGLASVRLHLPISTPEF